MAIAPCRLVHPNYVKSGHIQTCRLGKDTLNSHATENVTHVSVSSPQDNYGQNDQTSEEAVIDVYNQLGMKEAGLQFERDAFNDISAKINKHDEKIIAPLYTYVLESIF